MEIICKCGAPIEKHWNLPKYGYKDCRLSIETVEARYWAGHMMREGDKWKETARLYAVNADYWHDERDHVQQLFAAANEKLDEAVELLGKIKMEAGNGFYMQIFSLSNLALLKLRGEPIHTCATCGSELQIVRPGKYQCPRCE